MQKDLETILRDKEAVVLSRRSMFRKLGLAGLAAGGFLLPKGARAATNFLYGAGTNGYIATPFTALTTELNGLTNGSLTALGAAKTNTQTAQAILGEIWLTAGGSFTPTAASPNLAGWFSESTDGGTTFETLSISSSVPVRAPDFIIPLPAAAITSGMVFNCQGRITRLPPASSWKMMLQNNTGTSLPGTSNTVTVGPVAWQY